MLYYDALCRSEGPAQVFNFLDDNVWMMALLQHMTREQRPKVVLSYDNMCHVDNLRIARKPLESLPGDLKLIWLDITR